MKNIVLISADFPYTYSQFVKPFKDRGCNVFVIGGTPYNELDERLKNYVTHYYHYSDLDNLNEKINIVGCIERQFGHIDFIESNIEYWLRHDAVLREWFGVNSGIKPSELDDLQRKSSMKKFFIKAGIKVAPYCMVTTEDELVKFAEKFGYPLFAKPDIGVGSESNYKIKNIDDLLEFFRKKPQNIDYICETFISAKAIKTFDGLADKDSNVVYYDSLICPPSIFEIKEKQEDMFYYVNKDEEDIFVDLGKKLIKACGLKNRFFHVEFFIDGDIDNLTKDSIIGLEVNIRTPGGYSTDLINFALSTNIYEIFADVVCSNSTNVYFGERYYGACASRHDLGKYFFNDEDIKRTFKNELCFSGRYPEVYSDIMGNSFYMAKFKTKKEMFLFKEYVNKKIGESLKSSNHSNFSKTGGEDRRMLRERNDHDFSNLNICDNHIDGA